MRIPQSEYHHAFSLHLSAIADANYFQVPRPAFCYAFDSIVHQRAREAVDGSLRVILTDREEMPVLLLYSNPSRNRSIEFPLGPLDLNDIAFDFYRNPFGKRDRFSPNSRHKIKIAFSCQLSALSLKKFDFCAHQVLAES